MQDPVVEYLEANKDDYPKEDLVTELKKAGYSALEIQTGLKVVFEGAAMSNADVPSASQGSVVSESEEVVEEVVDENKTSAVDYIIKKDTFISDLIVLFNSCQIRLYSKPVNGVSCPASDKSELS